MPSNVEQARFNGQPRHTILAVEDSPGDMRLLKEALDDQDLPVNLYLVEDGQDAIDLLESLPSSDDLERPDLILLDLDLPRLSGKETLKKLQNRSDWNKIPVIVFTISEAAHDIEESYELGANCCLTKPIDFEDFEELVSLINTFWLQKAQLPPKVS